MPSAVFDDLESSWFELIDDIGSRIWLGELRSPGIERRCAQVGLQLVHDPAAADTVVVSPNELGLVDRLADTVTVVCLAPNRLRQLPWKRRAFGQRHAALLHRVVSATHVDGVRRGEVFGILPSITEPRVALSLRSPASRRLVLAALALHVRGPRLGLLRVLATAGRVVWFLYPAWLVVAHGRGRATTPRITGQFGYAQNDDVTRFLGEPPVLIERAGRSAHRAEEESALQELAGTSFAALVPRIEHHPDRGRGLVTSRLAGLPLSPRDLSDAELLRWTERAAATLAHLQRATAHDDGSVLVHGDFWLGNLAADGSDVVGVFDWELAHRGSPLDDREFLVDGLVRYLHRDQSFAEQLRQAVARGLGEQR